MKTKKQKETKKFGTISFSGINKSKDGNWILITVGMNKMIIHKNLINHVLKKKAS